MRIYEETNTAYCFTGSCEIESVDVIDFNMKMDKATKHETILKAKSLCSNQLEQIKAPIQKTKTMNPQVDRASTAVKFRRYHKSLHNHKSAKEYCEPGSLD